MPWLEAFEQLVDPSGGPVEPGILIVDDPTQGRIDGDGGRTGVLGQERDWLAARGGSRPARGDDHRRWTTRR